MRRILYLTLLLMSATGFCSCGSHKSNVKQETSIESGSNRQRKDTASLSEQVKITETEDVTETIEETTTVYDTSKPTNPATGKPPVLSETTKTAKKETAKKTAEDSVTTLNQSTVERLRDSTKLKDFKLEEKRKQETSVPRQIGGMLWALAALVALVIVGWLAHRWGKK